MRVIAPISTYTRQETFMRDLFYFKSEDIAHTTCFALVLLRVKSGGLDMDYNVVYVALVQHEVLIFCEFSWVIPLCIACVILLTQGKRYKASMLVPDTRDSWYDVLTPPRSRSTPTGVGIIETDAIIPI
ncbi:hypothetical protein POM88_034450 [Heracleum sosnowskyi]|uniref:Uncharacterized protein n=1 Tax=Heracleum sosnowskyi TaxID=360622 RepID=A0AAD8MDL2_9APIA|nr:hypothetical protein POM88_034450 [Heracleum sosnowskyi]